MRHHRPVRRPGRALRPGVRRPARQPLLRRRPGVAAPSTPGARPASSSCSAPTRRWPARSGSAPSSSTTAPRCSTSWWSTAGPPASSSATSLTGEVSQPLGPRRGAGHRRLRQRLLPVHQRHGLQRHRRLAGPPQGRGVRQPLLHADPPDLHPAERRLPVEAHADVGVAPQRRPHLGARRTPTTPARPTRSPRTSATTTSSAATRASATSCPRDIASRAAKVEVDEGKGVGPAQERRLPRLRRRHRPPRRRRHRGALRQPLRDVRAHHRRGPVRGARCASTPPSTTRWAGSGWTTS